MSEEKERTESTPKIHTIRLKRHLWPDEVQAKKERRDKILLKFAVIFMTVFSLLVGWIGGSLLPIVNLGQRRKMDANEKIGSVLNAMENNWYFGKDIDNLSERLKDQALFGITLNEEDPHTEYMSAEEAESFTQGINRNYVGIGVQYYQSGDASIVERVFAESPAQDAGLLPGDIFISIDGTPVAGFSTSEIKELVLGDEGTPVELTMEREGKPMNFTVIRGRVDITAFGYLLGEDTVYLQMYQFGDSTPQELLRYLEPLLQDGKKDLILDLRDNGGGYLSSLSAIASLFLPKDVVVMQREYKDGTIQEIRTTDGELTNVGDIVILINQGTASASEVLTLALREQRPGTVVVGETSYGKGTVQVSDYFADGSTLKYTTSRWLSPSGLWINKVGIEPDVKVELHEALEHSFRGMEEDEVWGVDTVSEAVKDAQIVLDYFDYNPGRTDGYFSPQTLEAMQAFERDRDLPVKDTLDAELYVTMLGAVSYDYSVEGNHDTQLQKAEELLHG